MKLATDYDSIFKNRVLYITGTGRSGTSILGKILSSMRPTVYLFEPAILRLVPNAIQGFYAGNSYNQFIKAVLFEDYCLPTIQGRSLNAGSKNLTFWGNSHTKEEITEKYLTLNRRKDVMQWIEREKPLFVIKNPEAQPHIEYLKDVFGGIQFIHMIRNGLDVVRSSVERGWFQDDYQPIDWIIEYNIPHYLLNQTETPTVMEYLSNKNKRKFSLPIVHLEWKKWNPETRAAHMWRVTTETGLKENINQLHYESFCKEPLKYVKMITEEFNLRMTPLTEKHIQSVIDFKPKEKKSISIDLIMEHERSKFIELMDRLGYQI